MTKFWSCPALFGAALAALLSLPAAATPYQYRVPVLGLTLAAAAPSTSCTTPWQASVADGASVVAYSISSVPFGSTCVSEVRTCNQGILQGSFQFSACSVSAPVAASLVGDGASTAGACAAGQTGCATLNPLDKHANITLSNNNLTATTTTASSSVRATLGKSAGKWYWEYTVTAAPTTNNSMLGMGTASMSLSGYPGAGNSATEGWGYWGNNGSMYHNGSSSAYNGLNYKAGAVIGVALDADAHTLTFYRAGVAQATIPAITATTWYPALSPMSSGTSSTITANFGQSNFTYAPPSGYHAGLY